MGETRAFRIDYSRNDLKNLSISIDQCGDVVLGHAGPGVYFKAINAQGAYILEEHRSLENEMEGKIYPIFFISIFTLIQVR